MAESVVTAIPNGHNGQFSIDAAGIPSAEAKEPHLFQFMSWQQHQLGRLSEVIMELMQHIWSPLAAPPAIANPQPSPQLMTHAPAHHASLPEQYQGDPEGCHKFLLVCELYLA